MKKVFIGLLALFSLPIYAQQCYSDHFNLEVRLYSVQNQTGKHITINAIGKEKWQERIDKNKYLLINKKLIPTTNLCNGVPMQEIATISVSNKVQARVWFSLIEQGDKKYTIQAMVTDSSGSRSLKYQHIISVDTLRYYEPDMHDKLDLIINLNFIGVNVLVKGQTTTEIRDIALEIAPATRALVTKSAKQAAKK